MWDRPDHPEVTFDADGKLFTIFEPEELHYRRQPVVAFFRYVPLTAHEVYASSLTIYFFSKCITGIEVHFPATSNLVGSRGNIAVHFPLAKDERISNVWLRLETHGAIESVPSLLVSSSSHISAPYELCLCFLDTYDARPRLQFRSIRWPN